MIDNFKYAFPLSLLLSSVLCSDTLTKTGSFYFANGGPFGQIGSHDPKYDALHFTTAQDLKIHFERDLYFSQPFYSVWKDITYGDISSPQRNIYHYGTNFALTKSISSGWDRNLHTESVTLFNADMTSEVDLLFLGDNNTLTLHNSGIFTYRSEMDWSALAPARIHAASGDNYLKGLNEIWAPKSLQIDVDAGASLEFIDAGNVTGSERLQMRAPTSANINNGTLHFSNSNAYINSTQNFSLNNSATLRLSGSNTKVEFEYLDVDSSQIDLQRNTTLQINEKLTLEDTTISFDDGATLFNDNLIKTQGSVTLSGSDFNTGIRGSGFLDMSTATTYTQNNVENSQFDYILMKSGSSITLNNSDLSVSSVLYAYDNVDININNGSFLRLYGTRAGDGMDLTIASGGGMLVFGEFHVNSNDNLVNNGNIDVSGIYRGRDTLSGTGNISIFDNGVFAMRYSSAGLLSMQTDNSMVFRPTFPSAFDTVGGIYRSVIDVNGGTAQSEQLLYGAGDIDITALKALEVSTYKPLSASDMDAKEFTLIVSQNAGVAGTLNKGANVNVVEGGSIPALIDFSVVDLNTNGKPDLTLRASQQPTNSLITHTNVTTTNQTGSANLLVNASNNGSNAINNALNNLTNGQVASHFNAIHAEPYSSYMTVALEQSDHIMNSVLSLTGSGFATGKRYTDIDDDTDRRFWMSASYIDGDMDGDNNLGDFDYALSSVIVGNDIIYSSESALGVYISYGSYKMDEHDLATQTIDTDTLHTGLYFNHFNPEGWQFHALLGYAYADNSSTRYAQLSHTLSEKAKGSYDSHMFYGAVMASVEWIDNDIWRLSPELGLKYTHYQQEDFTESNAPNLGLYVDEADAQSIVTSVGLNARFVSLSHEHEIYPLAFIRYEHDWYANRNGEHEIAAALASDKDHSIRFVGQNRGENIITTGVGLGSGVMQNFQVNGGVSYSKSTHANELGLEINLNYYW